MTWAGGSSGLGVGVRWEVHYSKGFDCYRQYRLLNCLENLANNGSHCWKMTCCFLELGDAWVRELEWNLVFLPTRDSDVFPDQSIRRIPLPIPNSSRDDWRHDPDSLLNYPVLDIDWFPHMNIVFVVGL